MEDLAHIFNMKRSLLKKKLKKLLKKEKTKKSKSEVNDFLKNVSIPKGMALDSIDLKKQNFMFFTKIFGNKS